MPGFSVVAGGASTELTMYPATVIGGDGYLEWAKVNRIEYSGDVMIPGKAFIEVQNTEGVEQLGESQLPLSDTSKNFKGFGRVKIEYAGSTIFIGNLVKKREIVESGVIQLEYWDDRWFLHRIPLRGCFVYDSNAESIKFLPRYDPRTNPDGYKNFTYSSEKPDLHVFSALAAEGTKAENSDESAGNEKASYGAAVYVTVSRWIRYLQYCATLQTAPTGYNNRWAKLDPEKVSWPVPKFTSDVINKKMPDCDFKGQSIAHALDTALKIAGDLGFRCIYGADGKTEFGFYDKTQTSGEQFNMELQRSGVVSDAKSAFAAVVETDYSTVSTAVLVEGAAPLIESEFTFTGTDSTSTLRKAWSELEEKNFMAIVMYAKNAKQQKIKTNTGSDLLPFSVAALTLARQTYPRVFCAFQISGDLDAIMQSIGRTGTAHYPYNKSFRPSMREYQLQPYFETDAGKRGRMRLPIRVQITDAQASDVNGRYHDVVYSNGLRFTDDGLIWFDGMTDRNGVEYDRIIYNDILNPNMLTTPSLLPKLKRIKINVAVTHDTRIAGFKDVYETDADVNSIREELDESLISTNTGPRLLHYVLNETGFGIEQQYGSYPTVSELLMVATDSVPPQQQLLSIPTGGLNKSLHADREQIKAHAERKLKSEARIKKSNTWRLLGIRLWAGIGMYCSHANLYPGGKHKIGASLARITYDFDNKETVLNFE